ncbi:MAG: hypothetical protein NTX77_07550 [Actinobacteria bacterium]|nr:hypothetical protein [Actinomycetota bacterium]
MKRSFVGALLIAFVLLSPASPALAHGGDGGASSDYEVVVTGYSGDATGVVVRSVDLGSRIELVRTTAKEVIVTGYSAEPYLRLDSKGVWENFNSPAHYLNLDRFASKTPPESASADATPDWHLMSSGSSVRWHDHRTHWMSSTPREDVVAQPDVERVIFPLSIDGREASAIVKVTWLPPPNKTGWLMAISVLAALLIVGLVLSERLRRLVPLLAAVGALAALVGQGSSSARLLMATAAVLLAAAALRSSRAQLSLVAAGAVFVLAATRLDVFEHALLQGAVAGGGQRIAISAALIISASIVFAQIVTWLSPKPAPAAQPAE